MPSINNAQNISRVYTKMTEGFHDEKDAKFCDCAKSFTYLNKVNSSEEISDEEIDVIGHMSYSPNEKDEDDEAVINCQTPESEVRFIKEWLILQTDLIQQQNDDIIDKDREIFILRKENEMLKEHIKKIEKGISFQIDTESDHKVIEDSIATPEAEEDMTQGPSEEDTKENINLVHEQYYDSEDCATELNNFEENNLSVSDNESHIEGEAVSEVLETNHSFCEDNSELELKSEHIIISEIADCYKTEPDLLNSENSISEYFSINNICDSSSDPMKNLRMSIRRKRACSNSSALSPNESLIEKEQYQNFKKKKRRLTKETNILVTEEPYVTQAQEVNLGILSLDPDIPDNSRTLEVPRWRHKIYASCYTMEGTENLDDEVYNKRHIRLEIDERRRKRWDVQRIREQRIIEKLKQRQERVASGSKGEENEMVPSMWPKPEELKYLEVCDELPVSAFGIPIPRIASSEFNLPWLGNPSVLTTKKPLGRRSTTGKRKNSKR